MPFDQKKYLRDYYQKNKEKLQKQHREYDKGYRQKNKEKIKAKDKAWRQSPSGLKFLRIWEWKKRGVIFFDFDLLYDIYISTTHCDNCNVEFTEDKINKKTTRCLDHCHETGEVRNILCVSCNVKRG